MADLKNSRPFISSGGPDHSAGFRLVGFPKEFERGFTGSLDKRFFTILFITWLISYTFFFMMSSRDWTISDEARALMKQNYMQRVYAEIVTTPEVTPEEETGFGAGTTEETTGGGGEEFRERAGRLVGESSSERVGRQRAGYGARSASRGRMEQEAAGYGVLAALTGGAGSGSGGLAYADILGDAGGVGSGLANAGDLVSGTAALQAATGRGQRSRIAKGGSGGGGGFGGEVGGTGIDDLISGTGVGGGASVSRRGSIKLAQETQVTGAGAGTSQRDPETIDAIINQNKASVEYCYQSQLKLDPNLRGEILLNFDILANGKVGAVKILSTTMNNSKVEQCIIKSVRRWVFPALTTGQGVVTIKTKFIFG